MTTTKTIKNTIKTLLSDIVGTDKNIRKIYGYFEPKPTEFPCVLIYMQNAEESRLDFANNQVDVEYIMKLILPLEKTADMEEIEDLRLDCMDDIMDRLRKKDAVESLGGVTFSTSINSAEPYMENGSDFPVLVTDISFQTSRSEILSS